MFSFWFVCLSLTTIATNGDAESCGVPKFKGDGNCDDENNNKGCEYDGGDCCYKTVSGGVVTHLHCVEVGCI